MVNDAGVVSARPPAEPPIRKLWRTGLRVASLSGASAIGMAIGVATLPVYARLLPPEIWGAAQLANRMLDLGHSLALPGINESALLSSSRGAHGNFRILLSMKFRAAKCVAALLLIIAAGYAVVGDSVAACMIAAGAMAFPWITRGYGVPDSWLEGAGNIGSLARLRIVRALATVLPLVVVVVSYGSAYYYAAVLAGMVASGWYAIATAARACDNENEAADLVTTGLKMTPARIVSGILLSLEFVAVGAVLGYGIDGLAGWGVAQIISNYFKMLLGHVQASVSSLMYAGDELNEKLRRLVPWTRVWFLGSLLGIAVFYSIGEPAFGWLLGEKWKSCAEISAALIVAVMAVSVTDFYGAIMIGSRDVTYHNTYAILIGVANLAAISAGAVTAGLIGVCVGKLVTMCFAVLVRLVFMLRHRTEMGRCHGHT